MPRPNVIDVRQSLDRRNERAADFERSPMGSWLSIPYDTNDFGNRKIPSGEKFWESPNIWIEGGDDLGNAVVGKPTRIFARIFNRAWVPCFPTLVTFAFVDASLGIPWSAPRIIGSRNVGVPSWILGAGTAIVECPVPWVPSVGSTHACLLVMCSCAIVGDVPEQPWVTVSDRHVGQRNLTVVAAKPGTIATFQLQTAPVLATRARTQISAQLGWTSGRDAFEALEFSKDGLANAVHALDTSASELELRLHARRMAGEFAQSRRSEFVPLDADEIRRSVRVEVSKSLSRWRDGTIVIPEDERARGIHDFVAIEDLDGFGPLERARVHVTLRVPRETHGMRHLVVRIAQIEDTFVTGGYTFVIDTSHQETSAA